MHCVAIASGKGGVGKTMLSANFGCWLAIEGHKVLIFDADLGLANLDIALGLNPTKTLKHVIRLGVPLRDVVIEGPAGLHVIPGGSGVAELVNMPQARLQGLIAEIQELAQDYDYVLFDAAAGIEPGVMAFLAAADETCLVCTPEPSSMIDAYATVKTLQGINPGADVAVVVNLADNPRHGVMVYERLRMITGQFLNRDLRYAGSVRRDEAALACARQRQAVVIAHPTAPSAKDIEETASQLFYRRPSEKAGKSLATRFLQAIGQKKAS